MVFFLFYLFFSSLSESPINPEAQSKRPSINFNNKNTMIMKKPIRFNKNLISANAKLNNDLYEKRGFDVVRSASGYVATIIRPIKKGFLRNTNDNKENGGFSGQRRTIHNLPPIIKKNNQFWRPPRFPPHIIDKVEAYV